MSMTRNGWLAAGLVLALVLGTATVAFAGTARVGDPAVRGVAGQAFVDADADGTCDNAGQAVRGQVREFVDADSDGTCDNAGQGRMGSGRGMMGSGEDFVDADGDGVCDNAGQGGGRGRGAMDGTGTGCDGTGYGRQ